MERVAVIMGKMHSGGKKNLVMEYYRNIDKTKIQFDFFCDTDSNAIPKDEITKLGGQSVSNCTISEHFEKYEPDENYLQKE